MTDDGARAYASLDQDVTVVLTPRQIIALLSLAEAPTVKRILDDARTGGAGLTIKRALERLAPAVGQTFPKEAQRGH